MCALSTSCKCINYLTKISIKTTKWSNLCTIVVKVAALNKLLSVID